MKRHTIEDLAKTAGLSVSTVDRVLNGRLHVKAATAKRVLDAADAIGFRAAAAIRHRVNDAVPIRKFGFILQQRSAGFYGSVGAALETAVRASADIRGTARVEYLDDLTPLSVSEHLLRLGKQVDAVALVAADHPHVTKVIDRLAGDGVPVFALISDLTAKMRAGYVGLDNWKVGRTAAWAISNMARRPGKIGIMVGNHRYLCQDVCEMSFRSYFRERAPDFHLLEPVVTLEDDSYAHGSALDLLRRAPDLVGLYIAGGGLRGALRALGEADPTHQVTVVGLDVTEETKIALIEGQLAMAICHPVRRMAETIVEHMIRATGPGAPEAPVQSHVDFTIITPENL